jgi:hypothetical protein
VLAGVFGLREIKNIRQAGEQVSSRAAAILADANDQLMRLKNEVAGIDGRMNSMVEVAYLFNQGELAYRAGEYPKVVDFLGRAATLDPRNARVLYRLGRSLTNLGDEAPARSPGRQRAGGPGVPHRCLPVGTAGAASPGQGALGRDDPVGRPDRGGRLRRRGPAHPIPGPSCARHGGGPGTSVGTWTSSSVRWPERAIATATSAL